VSAASPWEIAIKAHKGKIEFTGSACRLIDANGFLALSMTPEHAEAAGLLEWEHTDPFDRMLVVQACQEELVLVHADTKIRAYKGVAQHWARAD